MQQRIIKTASLFAALSVILGAFGAHGLKKLLTPDALSIYQTAVQYQFYHAFALFLIAFIIEKNHNKLINWAAILFITGIICFSGSLYLLVYTLYIHATNLTWIRIITPLGGLMFIAGWLCILFGVGKK